MSNFWQFVFKKKSIRVHSCGFMWIRVFLFFNTNYHEYPRIIINNIVSYSCVFMCIRVFLFQHELS